MNAAAVSSRDRRKILNLNKLIGAQNPANVRYSFSHPLSRAPLSCAFNIFTALAAGLGSRRLRAFSSHELITAG